MARQRKSPDVLAIEQPLELTDDLARLLEKRTGSDRRGRQRRGGPPRRSLLQPSTEEPVASDSQERRYGKERRQKGSRRQKPRRKA